MLKSSSKGHYTDHIPLRLAALPQWGSREGPQAGSNNQLSTQGHRASPAHQGQEFPQCARRAHCSLLRWTRISGGRPNPSQAWSCEENRVEQIPPEVPGLMRTLTLRHYGSESSSPGGSKDSTVAHHSTFLAVHIQTKQFHLSEPQAGSFNLSRQEPLVRAFQLQNAFNREFSWAPVLWHSSFSHNMQCWHSKWASVQGGAAPLTI